LKAGVDTALESHKAQLKASVDTALETYKARLQVENASATERLKADLQIAFSEHQIRYSRLHEKVAETVAETYHRLYNLVAAVEVHLTGWYGSGFKLSERAQWEEHWKAISHVMKEFTGYFHSRRLYFPKELANQIEECENTLIGFTQHCNDPHANQSSREKAYSQFLAEANPLFLSLEDEFRSLLGVRSHRV